MTDEDKKRQAAVLAEIAALPPGTTIEDWNKRDAHSAANFLFKDFRLSVLGKTPSSERFGRQLEYRDRGWR
jgi:hypothetical protein